MWSPLVAAWLTAGVPDAAFAGSQEERNVVIYVVNEEGAAIANAWVRIPGTEGRRMVDPEGKWEASSVYMTDGSKLPFTKGKELDLTVSAPGFEALVVRYTVQGRRNLITVPLRKMETPDFGDEDDKELVVRWFGRTTADEGDEK